MGKRDFYDPYTMVVKEIDELIPELNKLVMSQLPGGRPIQAVWALLCEASRTYAEAKADVEDEGGAYRGWLAMGRQQVAGSMIRKVADGLGVSNFKLREVPLERPESPEVPAVQGDEPGGHPGPSGQGEPG